MAERVLSARTRRRLKQKVSEHLLCQPNQQDSRDAATSSASEHLDDGNYSTHDYSTLNQASTIEDHLDESSFDHMNSAEDSTSSDSDTSSISNSSSLSSLTDSESDSTGVSTTASSDEEPFCELPPQLPLFPQAKLTCHSFNVSLMSLVQRHNLTYACQADILQLCSVILPTPNTVPSSALTLRRQFMNFGEATITHHFCGSCIEQLQHSSRCDKQDCISSMVPSSTFIEIPLDKQLIDKFRGKAIILYLWHPLKYIVLCRSRLFENAKVPVWA